MKLGKRILSLVLAAVMCCGMGFAVSGTEAEAAAKVTVPKVIRCGVGMRKTQTITINMPGKDDKIKNVKVYEGSKKTKNLVVKETYRYRYSGTGTTSTTYPSTSNLTFYAKKEGVYKIKFDVYKTKTARRSSHTITVRAKEHGDSIIQGVTLDGQNIWDPYNPYSHYTTKKSGKLKFTLADGCKIKKITVSYPDKKGKTQYKSIKNGKKVTFGQYGYQYSTSSSWGQNMWAGTSISITYTDKYNQKGVTYYTNYTIYTKANKWYKSQY
ncbi:MAG: hypothetical protein HFH41_02875 [Lachnospiraceae bacterium]|nr:hypothetical protein [Lachnospiraceae bacterium]